MLTIQPKFTQYSQQQRNNIAFKSAEMAGIPEDSFYEDKTRYYKDQIREFDTLIEDEHTPNAFKKVLKGFRVVSEGLLEGCAVAWGASKGAKVIKSAAVKGATSDFTKRAINIMNPIIEGFKTTGGKIWKAIGEKFTSFKTSKFATDVAEKFTKFVGKMRDNKVGKYIVKGFELVGSAFKWVGKNLVKAYEAVASKAKAMNGSEAYDKAANIASKTLGAGAGVAGAYNAATRADERAENIQTEVDQFGEVEELEDFIEDGE